MRNLNSLGVIKDRLILNLLLISMLKVISLRKIKSAVERVGVLTAML